MSTSFPGKERHRPMTMQPLHNMRPPKARRSGFSRQRTEFNRPLLSFLINNNLSDSICNDRNSVFSPPTQYNKREKIKKNRSPLHKRRPTERGQLDVTNSCSLHYHFQNHHTPLFSQQLFRNTTRADEVFTVRPGPTRETEGIAHRQDDRFPFFLLIIYRVGPEISCTSRHYRPR